MNDILTRKCARFECQQIFTDLDNYIDKTNLSNSNSYLSDGILVRKEYHKTCWAKIEERQEENKKILVFSF